ncbi:MAG: OmpH family outer membrane protein [Planctomycetes bacterium]|nr:OmpH family outer membrane protein [Planctomycetota bacterium]
MRNTIIILLLLLLSSSIVANRSFADPQDKVRYVNIDQCLQEWQAYNSVREQLATETKLLTDQLAQQSESIQLRRADLDLLDPNSSAANELALQISIAEETLKFQNQMASRQMQERTNAAFARALIEINQACATVGEQQGYSSIVTQPFALDRQYPDSATHLNQLVSRTVNWTNPAFDVTSEVVGVLNMDSQ